MSNPSYRQTPHNNGHMLYDDATQRVKEYWNLNSSPVGRCPPEVHKDIVQYVTDDPISLKNLSHSCTAFRRVIDNRDWRRCYQSMNPTWSKGVRYEEKPPTSTSSWMQHTLLDVGLKRRFEAELPPLSDDSKNESIHDDDWTMVDADAPSSADAISGNDAKKSKKSKGLIAPRLLLNKALPFKTDEKTGQGQFKRIGSPAYYIDYETNTIIAASVVTRPTGKTGKGAWLQDRQILFYGLPDLTNPIAVCGSEVWTEEEAGKKWHDPVSEVDELQVMQVAEVRHFPNTIVNGAMRVLLVLAFGQGYDSEDVLEAQILDIWRIVRVVEVWLPVAAPTSPTSRFSFFSFPWGSSSSGAANATAGSKSASTPILKSLGENINPWPPTEPSTMIHAPVKIRKGRCETIAPSQHSILFRGRVVKLYESKIDKATPGNSTREQPEKEKVDCITLFGLEHSESSSALVIKKILFVDKVRGDASWSKRMISRGVSCMTLFPPHSHYGRMMVMVNRHGRGMIWDWVHERQIAQLHLPVDQPGSTDKGATTSSPAPPAAPPPAVTATSSSSSSTAMIVTSNGPTPNADTPTGETAGQALAETAGPSAVRNDVYYWGVQVSWTLEASTPPPVDAKLPCSFRIVTLADGEENQSETCWWHVDESILGEPEAELEAPPMKRLPSVLPPTTSRPVPSSSQSYGALSASAPPTTTPLPPTKGPLYAQARRFISATLGYCLPEQQAAYGSEDGKPVHTIAYVVWNHYRIGLTTKLGLTMYDMERAGGDEPNNTPDQQWVTYLDDAKDDPLVDIAIVGDHLVITRRHGHMVVPLYGERF